MQSILIVEDDIYISDMVVHRLQQEDFHVLKAYSGTEALLVLASQQPDIILLDLMLPGLSGEEVLSSIENIPVIVMSAKADVNDKVQLLLNGAVDYITKPFHLDELVARITVQLRKMQHVEAQQQLTYDDITMNTKSHTVQVHDTPIKLTRTEFAILKCLLLHPQQVVTKSQILDVISSDTPDCTEATLKVHMSNIRIKLREVTCKDYIQAVWGIGFKFASH